MTLLSTLAHHIVNTVSVSWFAYFSIFYICIQSHLSHSAIQYFPSLCLFTTCCRSISPWQFAPLFSSVLPLAFLKAITLLALPLSFWLILNHSIIYSLYFIHRSVYSLIMFMFHAFCHFFIYIPLYSTFISTCSRSIPLYLFRSVSTSCSSYFCSFIFIFPSHFLPIFPLLSHLLCPAISRSIDSTSPSSSPPLLFLSFLWFGAAFSHLNSSFILRKSAVVSVLFCSSVPSLVLSSHSHSAFPFGSSPFRQFQGLNGPLRLPCLVLSLCTSSINELSLLICFPDSVNLVYFCTCWLKSSSFEDFQEKLRFSRLFVKIRFRSGFQNSRSVVNSIPLQDIFKSIPYCFVSTKVWWSPREWESSLFHRCFSQIRNFAGNPTTLQMASTRKQRGSAKTVRGAAAAANGDDASSTSFRYSFTSDGSL